MNAEPRAGVSHSRLNIAAIIIALIALGAAFRVPILQVSAWPLIASDNDHIHKADAILILGGGLDTRPFEAVRLYRAGLAPLLLVANEEPGPASELGLDRSGCEITLDILTKIEQVPPEHIVLIGLGGSERLPEARLLRDSQPYQTPGPRSPAEIGYVASTFDEATALKRWFEATKAGSVIIVTNPLYSQRVRRIFNKILERGTENETRSTPVTIQVATIDCRKYTPLDWWRSEEGLIAFNNEWIKTFYYWLKY
jgi:uncharacterized SAM-binding protein YcdF (DUF218 family)